MKWLWKLIVHDHIWEHPIEKGEEEHGPNGTKRICIKCGKDQWLCSREFPKIGEPKYFWKDSPDERMKKLKF